MQLIHGSGYSDEERASYREIIFTNAIQSMKVILEAMDVLNIALGNPGANAKHRQVLMDLPAQVCIFV